MKEYSGIQPESLFNRIKRYLEGGGYGIPFADVFSELFNEMNWLEIRWQAIFWFQEGERNE